MFETFRSNLTWRELFIRTLKEAHGDNCLGLAAQLAYYFLLALVPAIVFIAALASFFPGPVIDEILRGLGSFAPPHVLEIIREQLRALAGREDGGVLTVGLALALWSSSAAMVAITDALNRAYDIEEGRPWWKSRLTAIALTVTLAVFVLVAFALVMVGPTTADHLAARFGFGPVFTTTWKVLQWPAALALVVLAVGFVYYFAPDAEQEWEWVTPGAVLATVLWLVASLIFKTYVTAFADYNEAYGPLGGVVVLMLWFYLSGLAILTGAEMNAEIEHASPHGKAPGEKVPGQRKKIGRLAAREYAEKQAGRSPQPAIRPSVAAYTVVGLGLVKALARDWSALVQQRGRRTQV